MLACCIFIYAYGLRFTQKKARNWYKIFPIGSGMVLLVFNTVRCAIITLDELRRFEVRKRVKAFFFAVRLMKVDVGPPSQASATQTIGMITFPSIGTAREPVLSRLGLTAVLGAGGF